MEVRSRQRGNAGRASWSDRGIRQPVRHYAYQELTYTAYGKAKEGKGKHKNGATVRAGPKRRNRSREGKSFKRTSAFERTYECTVLAHTFQVGAET